MTLTAQSTTQTATTAAKPARFYRPELDVLRFVAFVLVFFHHLLPDFVTPGTAPWLENLILTFKYSAGNGLSLFFLLSSYLITELLLRETESTGTVHIKAFYVRRVLRIWPLYFGFLLFSILLGHVVPVLYVSPSYLLQYLFLIGNHAFYHAPTMAPLGPLWSISVEEQFYLIWPFLALWAGRRGLLAFSLALIPISLISGAWLTYHSFQPGFAIWTNSLTEFECFGFGGLLALALHKREWKISVPLRAALLALCAGAWFISDGILNYKRNQMIPNASLLVQVGGFQLVTIGCVFIFLAVLGLKLGPWSKPFIYLGRISYGLYVFHIFCRYVAMRIFSLAHVRHFMEMGVTNLMLLALAFALTVAIASLSYRFYEKPFLHLKQRFTFVSNRVD